MKISLLLFVILKCSFLFAQINGSDSIKKHIDSLNWNSFTIAYTYFAHLKISGDAEAIKNFDEKQVTVMLLNSLSIESKAVISHMLLSQMFEPEDSSLKTTIEYKNDSINSPVSAVIYTYNQLNWKFDIDKATYTISNADMDRIKNYWKTKLKL